MNIFTALFKLSKPAKISISSQVAKICLPFADVSVGASYQKPSYDDLDMHYDSLIDRDNNNLRKIRQSRHNEMIFFRKNLPKTAKHMVQELVSKSLMTNRAKNDRRNGKKASRRRNDKFAGNLFGSKRFYSNAWNRDIHVEDVSYYECIATGWGVDGPNGDLTDVLLQTKVPIHTNDRSVLLLNLCKINI